MWRPNAILLEEQKASELMMHILRHIIKNHKADLTEIMKPDIRDKIRLNIQTDF